MKLSLNMLSLAVFAIPQSIYGKATKFDQVGKFLAKGMDKVNLWDDFEPDEICNKVLCKEDGKECFENLGCLDDAEACKEECNEDDWQCYRSCKDAFEYCASNCTATFEVCVEEGHPELDLCLDCFNKTDEGDNSTYCEDLFDDFDKPEGSEDDEDKSKDDVEWEDLEPGEICNKVLCKEDGKECFENLGCLDDGEACMEECNEDDWQCYRSCKDALEYCASNCTATFELCVEEGHPELDLCLDCFNKTDEGDNSTYCEDLFDDFDKSEGSKDEAEEKEDEGTDDDTEDEKEDDNNTDNDDVYEGKYNDDKDQWFDYDDGEKYYDDMEKGDDKYGNDFDDENKGEFSDEEIDDKLKYGADDTEIESSARDDPTEIQSVGENGLRGSSNDSDSGASSSAGFNGNQLPILTFGLVTVGVYVLLI